LGILLRPRRFVRPDMVHRCGAGTARS
jgi:hypothetical protein